MIYKTIALKQEVYDMIKELASKEKRGVSNFIEHELIKEK
jgi:predicted CopG family antitoxin